MTIIKSFDLVKKATDSERMYRAVMAVVEQMCAKGEAPPLADVRMRVHLLSEYEIASDVLPRIGYVWAVTEMIKHREQLAKSPHFMCSSIYTEMLKNPADFYTGGLVASTSDFENNDRIAAIQEDAALHGKWESFGVSK
jgi:hypothetical protein